MSVLDKRGLVVEDEIILKFKFNGEGFTKSSFKDDYYKDVDAHHPQLGKVSIKSQSNVYSNFAVEIRQEDSRDNSQSIDGWFLTSEADTYILAIRDDEEGVIEKLHLINSLNLKNYIDKHSFKEVFCHHAKKFNKGRKYDLPVVHLLALDTLKRDGIIFKTFKPK